MEGATTKKSLTTETLVDGILRAGVRHDLTEAQWAILASLLVALLPVGQQPGSRP